MNALAAAVGPAGDVSNWPRWLRNLLRRSPDGIPQQWQGGWLLAVGGGGTAAIWVTYDHRNRVNGRMVVKTVAISRRDWWDPPEWSDGLNATGYRDFTAPINHTLPTEAIINRRLTQVAGAPIAPQTENPICRYLGHSAVDQRHRRWKLFLEYCPAGSLAGLMDDMVHPAGAIHFPEPFTWYVAEQSLLAIKIMQQGDTGAGIAGWRPLVHRDIKPANVFLGERDTTQFRCYPKIKFGDFGLTIETDENDNVNNPTEFNDMGTIGYLAPEQWTWYKRNGKQDFDRKLHEKTQVWAVGMLCYCLYTRRRFGNDINYNIVNDRTPFVSLAFPELGQFLRDCLQYDPNLRPTIDQALARVQTPVPPRDNFAGMRAAIPAVHIARDTNPGNLWIQPNGGRDTYKLGFAKGSLPPVR